MNRSTVAIFEILEKAWATQNCTLVDMKVCAAPYWSNPARPLSHTTLTSPRF